ncbi:MAG: hypothetical protein WDW36_003051 [Sanguina aurantia]
MVAGFLQLRQHSGTAAAASLPDPAFLRGRGEAGLTTTIAPPPVPSPSLQSHGQLQLQLPLQLQALEANVLALLQLVQPKAEAAVAAATAAAGVAEPHQPVGAQHRARPRRATESFSGAWAGPGAAEETARRVCVGGSSGVGGGGWAAPAASQSLTPRSHLTAAALTRTGSLGSAPSDPNTNHHAPRASQSGSLRPATASAGCGRSTGTPSASAPAPINSTTTTTTSAASPTTTSGSNHNLGGAAGSVGSSSSSANGWFLSSRTSTASTTSTVTSSSSSGNSAVGNPSSDSNMGLLMSSRNPATAGTAASAAAGSSSGGGGGGSATAVGATLLPMAAAAAVLSLLSLSRHSCTLVAQLQAAHAQVTEVGQDNTLLRNSLQGMTAGVREGGSRDGAAAWPELSTSHHLQQQLINLDAAHGENSTLTSSAKTAHTRDSEESAARQQEQRTLTAHLREREQQLQQLTLGSRLAQQQQIALENKLRGSQAEVQTAQAAVAASAAALAQATDAAAVTAADLVQTRAQLVGVAAQLAQARAAAGAAGAARQLASELAAARLLALSAAEAVASAAQLRVLALEQARSHATTDTSSLRSRLEACQGTLASTQGELSAVHTQLRDSAVKLAGMEAELAAGRRSSSEAHAATVCGTVRMEAQLVEAAAASEDLRAELVGLRAGVAGMRGEAEASLVGRVRADEAHAVLQRRLESVRRAGEEEAAEMGKRVLEARCAMERAHDELKATKRDARLATNQLQQGLDEALRQCTLHEAALSTAGLADRDAAAQRQQDTLDLNAQRTALAAEWAEAAALRSSLLNDVHTVRALGTLVESKTLRFDLAGSLGGEGAAGSAGPPGHRVQSGRPCRPGTADSAQHMRMVKMVKELQDQLGEAQAKLQASTAAVEELEVRLGAPPAPVAAPGAISPPKRPWEQQQHQQQQQQQWALDLNSARRELVLCVERLADAELIITRQDHAILALNAKALGERDNHLPSAVSNSGTPHTPPPAPAPEHTSTAAPTPTPSSTRSTRPNPPHSPRASSRPISASDPRFQQPSPHLAGVPAQGLLARGTTTSASNPGSLSHRQLPATSQMSSRPGSATPLTHPASGSMSGPSSALAPGPASTALLATSTEPDTRHRQEAVQQRHSSSPGNGSSSSTAAATAPARLPSGRPSSANTIIPPSAIVPRTLSSVSAATDVGMLAGTNPSSAPPELTKTLNPTTSTGMSLHFQGGGGRIPNRSPAVCGASRGLPNHETSTSPGKTVHDRPGSASSVQANDRSDRADVQGRQDSKGGDASIGLGGRCRGGTSHPEEGSLLANIPGNRRLLHRAPAEQTGVASVAGLATQASTSLSEPAVSLVRRPNPAAPAPPSPRRERQLLFGATAMAATFQPGSRELDDKAASMFPLFASEGADQLDSKQLMTALTETGALHGVGRQRLGEIFSFESDPSFPERRHTTQDFIQMYKSLARQAPKAALLVAPSAGTASAAAAASGGGGLDSLVLQLCFNTYCRFRTGALAAIPSPADSGPTTGHEMSLEQLTKLVLDLKLVRESGECPHTGLWIQS